MDFEIKEDGEIVYEKGGRDKVLAKLNIKAMVNYKENLEMIKKHNQLVYLPLKNKDIIIVGAGPSLKTQMKHLKLLSEIKSSKNQYYFVIMVVDAAYKFCVLNNIRIDYVVTSESSEQTYFNIPHDGRSILLAYAGSGSAKFWKGSIHFHDYMYEKKWHLNKTGKLPLYPTGFIILNTCLGICQRYQARAVILIGNDLCMRDKKNFYAYAWNTNDPENTGYNDDVFIKVRRGIYTTNAFALAGAWLVNWYRHKAFGFVFVNCSYPSLVKGLPTASLKEIYYFMTGQFWKERISKVIRKFTRWLR